MGAYAVPGMKALAGEQAVAEEMSPKAASSQ
jgi:hypothetical protein